MNTSRFFWGTLWIVAGVLILLAKLGVMTLQIGSLWKFWPVVLILWGIGLFTGAKAVRSLIAVVAAILLALIIYGVWEEWGSGRDPRELTNQTFMETYDSAFHQASLRFVSGAGSFTLRDTCEALLRAETATDFGKYEMDSRTGSGEKDLTLLLADHPKGFRTGGTNSVTIRLNSRPVWALRFEIGAAKLFADLAPFTVENIDIKTGAADVRVRLGDRAEECRVNIHAGVSSISVQVPESAGCEISSESGLSSKTFDGFVERGGGNYRTENFGTASRKIFLSFKAGVSSLKVVRY
jgi:uncharacterized membrane protein